MEPNRIGVLVVDRNPLLREGLSVLIRFEPDMDLLAATASAEDAARLFELHTPDVTLVDSDIPFCAGIKAIRAIRRINPRARILGMVAYEWDESWPAALHAGAWRCVAKDRLNRELAGLIRECARTGA